MCRHHMPAGWVLRFLDGLSGHHFKAAASLAAMVVKVEQGNQGCDQGVFDGAGAFFVFQKGGNVRVNVLHGETSVQGRG